MACAVGFGETADFDEAFGYGARGGFVAVIGWRGLSVGFEERIVMERAGRGTYAKRRRPFWCRL